MLNFKKKLKRIKKEEIDNILQRQINYSFAFENLLNPDSCIIDFEIHVSNELLRLFDAIKSLIGDFNKKTFQNETYEFELKETKFRKTLFILDITNTNKWHITLTINKGIDIEKVIDQMKIYVELLKYLKKLGYGKK